MPMPTPNLTGKYFGHLVVIRRAPTMKHARWECVCDCGRTKIVRSGHLISGTIRSCGCMLQELRANGGANLKHGATRGNIHSREYISWRKMIERCNNPNDISYKNYGGRGIVVCVRWKYFEHFLSDMGPRSKDQMLDRIDVDGNYEPGNCRWATRDEQQFNTRRYR